MKLLQADIDRIRAVQVDRRLDSKATAIRQLLRERLDQIDLAKKEQDDMVAALK